MNIYTLCPRKNEVCAESHLGVIDSQVRHQIIVINSVFFQIILFCLLLCVIISIPSHGK